MRRSKAQRGETLIEAMCALAVFTIGMLGVLTMNTLATQQNGLALHETQAANIARDVVDAFSRLPYSHPALALSSSDPTAANFTDKNNSDTLFQLTDSGIGLDGNGTDHPLTGAAWQITGADNPVGFHVYWRVAADLASDGTEQGKVIAVFVTYPVAKGGILKTVTVWTYKYDPDAVISPGAKIQEI